MKFFQIALATFFLAFGTVCAKEHRDTKPLPALTLGSSNTAQSNKYASMIGDGTTASAFNDRTFILNSVTGYVYLSMPYTGTALPLGEATVPVKVTYTVEQNGKIVTNTKITFLQLSVTASKMRNVVYEKFENAISIKAEVLSTDGTHTLSVPSTFTTISAQVIVATDYYEKMAINVIQPGAPGTGVTLTKGNAAVVTDNNLVLEWSEVPQAESYELEWTYVSNQSDDKTKLTIPLEPNEIPLRDYLFKNNSSRVEVKGLNYRIPLLYEAGYIAYRLRAIGNDYANGKTVIVKSNWTAEDNGTYLSDFPPIYLYKHTGLEKNLNWQSSLSFAEEGKNKAVISYFDGSSRNRQAVTRINTDQRAIVGETMYDYNGRPNIQLLPVPTEANELLYYPQFNIVTTKYEKSSTAIEPTAGSCDPVAPVFKDTKGSSKYYSLNNGFSVSEILNRELIPKANGFPYTQTKYTQDNTGRIAAQSGVGETHKLGSGKETKYLYAAPQQAEISRLFGTQVGNAAHYKKNVVIDPNNQVSVSYLDLDGKVIATALAGEKPATVQNLGDASTSRTVTTNLIDPVSNKLSGDNTVKELNYKFVVTDKSTTYTIHYLATVQSFGVTCQNAQTGPQVINFDGVVRVDLKLTDQCKVSYIDDSRSTNKGMTGAPKTVPTFDKLGSITLPQGEYQLTKTLYIDEVKLEEYWQYYLDPTRKCIVTEQNVVDSAKATAYVSGCNVSCATCQTSAQNLVAQLEANATPDHPLAPEEKDRILHQCDDLCRSNITCISALYSMIADVSMGGQYGEIQKKNATSPAQPTLDVNSLNADSKVEATEYDIPFSGANNEGTFIQSNPDNATLQPELFLLSIYNPNNRLKKPDYITAPEHRAFWWYPVKVVLHNSTDFPNNASNQPANNTNAVLMRGFSLENATYEATDYYDENNQKVYVETTYDPVAQKFDPELRIPVTNTNLVLLDAETQRYKAPVKYLLNLVDFRKAWKQTFAHFLVPYHPEFPYFIECSKNEAVNEFEYKLITAEKPSDDVGHLFMNAGGAFVIINNDPLFANRPAYKAWMQNKFDNYKKIEGNYVSMPQIAMAATNCSGMTYASSSCGTTNCYTGTISDATPNSWNMFKSLYLTERQKIQRQMVTDYALAHKFYNGCIGDNRFLSTNEGLVMNTPVASVSSESKTRERCSFNAFGVKINCRTQNYTEYHTIYSIPLYDPTQTCYAYDKELYYDKSRLFYPKTSPAPELDAPKCSTEVISAGVTVSIPEYCDGDLQNYAASMSLQAARIKFESCGLCPQATDLEQLLMSLKSKNWLQDNIKHSLTCNKEGGAVLLGNTLLILISPIPTTTTPSGYYDVDWQGSYSGTTLTAALTRLGKTINLTLNFSAGGSFVMKDLRFCCLTVNSSNSFTLTAYHYPAVAGQNTQKVEFPVTGTITDLDLVSCSNIPPRCAVTQVARNVNDFLDMLIMQSPSLDSKQNDFTKATMALDAANIGVFYEVVFRTLTGFTQYNTDPETYANPLSTYQPTWSATITGNLLDGSLKYVEQVNGTPVNKSIPISVEKGTAVPSFQDIKGFVNVRPSSVAPSPCAFPTSFCSSSLYEADAMYVDANGKKAYAPVKITVKFQTATVCQPVQIKSSN